jgi:phosphatidylglycerol:prolipoprotein diacylglycerol transferase
VFPFFELFGKTIGMYQLAAVCGILAWGIYACRMTKKAGHDDNDMIIFLIIAVIGSLIGSHLLYGLINYQYLIKIFENPGKITSFKILLQYISVVFGGGIFFGGLIMGLMAAFIYAKKAKLDFNFFSDIAAPGIPLFHFFGRIGCFMAGCCFGIESPFGFTFHNSPIEGANEINRFPVQLLEALFNLGLFFLLAFLFRRGWFKNRLLLLYLSLYSFGRFFIEYLRGDDYRGIWFGISTSQIISIAVFGISALLYIKKYRSIPQKQGIKP